MTLSMPVSLAMLLFKKIDAPNEEFKSANHKQSRANYSGVTFEIEFQNVKI